MKSIIGYMRLAHGQLQHTNVNLTVNSRLFSREMWWI